MVDINALRRLTAYRNYITKRQYLTIKGQIFAGDPQGAMKGLDKILQNVFEHKR